MKFTQREGKKRVYDDDRDTFCLDWWAPNYTKIKEMARAQHVRSTPSRAQICRSQMIYRHSKNEAPEFIGETTLKETPEKKMQHKISSTGRGNPAPNSAKRGGFEHANQSSRFRRYWKTPTCLVVVTTRSATGR
jgi:hypothetical protein